MSQLLRPSSQNHTLQSPPRHSITPRLLHFRPNYFRFKHYTVRYSPVQRFHRPSFVVQRNLRRFFKSRSSNWWGCKSGTAVGYWNRNEFGVKTGSWGLSSKYVRGRVFMHTSTSSTISSNSEKDKSRPPTVLRNIDLKIPMRRSYWPPHHGAFARLNRQTGLQRASWNFSSFQTFLSHVTAALKVAPLSEYTTEGLPRRAIKRLKLCRNSSVSRLFNSSRCTPRVRLHAKTTK